MSDAEESIFTSQILEAERQAKLARELASAEKRLSGLRSAQAEEQAVASRADAFAKAMTIFENLARTYRDKRAEFDNSLQSAVDVLAGALADVDSLASDVDTLNGYARTCALARVGNSAEAEGMHQEQMSSLPGVDVASTLDGQTLAHLQFNHLPDADGRIYNALAELGIAKFYTSHADIDFGPYVRPPGSPPAGVAPGRQDPLPEVSGVAARLISLATGDVDTT